MPFLNAWSPHFFLFFPGTPVIVSGVDDPRMFVTSSQLTRGNGKFNLYPWNHTNFHQLMICLTASIIFHKWQMKMVINITKKPQRSVTVYLKKLLKDCWNYNCNYCLVFFSFANQCALSYLINQLEILLGRAHISTCEHISSHISRQNKMM